MTEKFVNGVRFVWTPETGRIREHWASDEMPFLARVYQMAAGGWSVHVYQWGTEIDHSSGYETEKYALEMAAEAAKSGRLG